MTNVAQKARDVNSHWSIIDNAVNKDLVRNRRVFHEHTKLAEK